LLILESEGAIFDIDLDLSLKGWKTSPALRDTFANSMTKDTGDNGGQNILPDSLSNENDPWKLE
jgi:hypothetical protein